MGLDQPVQVEIELGTEPELLAGPVGTDGKARALGRSESRESLPPLAIVEVGLGPAFVWSLGGVAPLASPIAAVGQDDTAVGQVVDQGDAGALLLLTLEGPALEDCLLYTSDAADE